MHSCCNLQSRKVTLSSSHFHLTWLSLPEEYVSWVGREQSQQSTGVGERWQQFVSVSGKCIFRTKSWGHQCSRFHAQMSSACSVSPFVEPNRIVLHRAYSLESLYNQFSSCAQRYLRAQFLSQFCDLTHG